LLRPLDLAGAVITADALHTQREHAEFLVTEKDAHYILVVKKNQPSLYSQLKNLPWLKIPIMHAENDHGHGRDERRTIKILTLAGGLLFPHAAQAILITRRTRKAGASKSKTTTVYAVTSLATHHAKPAQIAQAGSAATGASKHSTTSGTSPSVRTPHRSGPATGPARWPPSETW
jgi:predicted transposase YbfD/YdcC